MSEQKFIEAIRALGIDIDDKKIYDLNKYYEMLVETNKVMNLTNIIEKEMFIKTFL